MLTRKPEGRSSYNGSDDRNRPSARAGISIPAQPGQIDLLRVGSPFGKEPDPLDLSRLIDCPEEQAVLERIRQLRAEGKGAKAIPAALQAEGFPCRGACT